MASLPATAASGPSGLRGPRGLSAAAPALRPVGADPSLDLYGSRLPHPTCLLSPHSPLPPSPRMACFSPSLLPLLWKVPSSSPVPPSGSIKTRPVSPVRVPLPIYPPTPRLASWPVPSAPLLNLLAAPSTCLQGRRASYPARLGGVSVGTCPWATPRVPSLLPRLPRRAGNRAQGRAGAEGGSTWPVSRQGKGVAGRVSWHGEGTRGETGGTDFGASRQNRTGRGKGTSLGGHLSCAGPFARHSV